MMPWYIDRFRGYGWDKVREIKYKKGAKIGFSLLHGACMPRALGNVGLKRGCGTAWYMFCKVLAL
jgi:hypothetical protein